MSELLAMGGYGAYVWSCIGITFLVTVICAWLSMRRHRKVIHQLTVRHKAMEKGQ